MDKVSKMLCSKENLKFILNQTFRVPEMSQKMHLFYRFNGHLTEDILAAVYLKSRNDVFFYSFEDLVSVITPTKSLNE